jgi:hypothetical protein
MRLSKRRMRSRRSQSSHPGRLIVFTDVQLGGAVDGLMLAHWVHKHHPGIGVSVTSGKNDTAVSSGLITGDAFFPKPSLEAVAARIQSLLEE